MDVMEAIKLRRSIRKFKSTPVPDEYLQELLEAARLAPSGTNIQPWRFIVVRSTEAKEKLAGCTPLPFVGNAPLTLICCVDNEVFGTRGDRVRELQEAGAFVGTPLESTNSQDYLKNRQMDEAAANAYINLNLAIAIENIVLQATNLGLGTCWVMMFSPAKVKEAFQIEDRYRVVALLPIGYPDQNPAPRPRLTREEIILKEV